MSNSPAYGLSQLALDLPNTSSNIVAVSTSGITRLYIDPNGNVGIGTTVPLSVLDVGGQANFQNNVTIAGNIIVNNITSNNSISFSNLTVTGNVIAASFQPTSSTIATNGMFLPAVNSLGLATNGSERMRIDANGALDVSGIASFRSAVSVAGAAVVSSLTSNGAISGSSITTGTLTSSGNLTFTGTGNRITGDFSNSPVANRVMFQTSTLNGQTNVYAIPNGSSTTAAFSVSGSNDPDNAAIGQFLQFGGTTTIRSVQTGTGSYTPITFWTSGSESMRIDTSGNVGIGISSPSTYGKLAVSGNMYAGDTTSTADGTITIGSNGAGSVAITRTGTGATNSAMTFSTTFTTLQERMRIDSLGNVGIGISSPSTKLTVSGTQTIRGAGTDGGIYTCLYMDENTSPYTSTFAGYTLSLNTGGNSARTSRLYIDQNGNVGIGTSSPGTYGKLASVTGDNATTFAAVGATNMLRVQGYNSTYVGTVIESVNLAQSANTPLFINGSKTLFGISGTERMRIDSSGNLGLGTTYTPTYLLNIGDGSNANASVNIFNDQNIAGSNWVLRFSRSDNSYAAGIKQLGYTNGSGGMAFITGAGVSSEVERARIDSSGNMGIGTTSPSKKLEVYANANSLQILSVVRNDNAGTGVAAIGFNTSSSAAGEATSTKAGIGLVRGFPFGGGSLAFYNNNSGAAGDFTTADEKMRIDASGNWQLGTTTNLGKMTTVWNNSTQTGFALYASTATFSGSPIVFFNSSGAVSGSIGQSASTVSYNTSSDYRLKENVLPLTSGLTTISALKPVKYDWKIEGSHGEGFIAHELQEVIPLAVTGDKDAVNEDGTIKSQGVDYSKIVVHLVAAIQELKAEFDAYKESHP